MCHEFKHRIIFYFLSFHTFSITIQSTWDLKADLQCFNALRKKNISLIIRENVVKTKRVKAPHFTLYLIITIRWCENHAHYSPYMAGNRKRYFQLQLMNFFPKFYFILVDLYCFAHVKLMGLLWEIDAYRKT